MADEMASAFRHRRGIERRRDMPDPAALQCRRRPAIENAIAVMPPPRRQPRVEAGRHRLDREDADSVRAQMVVDCAADRLGIGLTGEIDMRDLGQRVHPGIGAAGAVDGQRLAAKPL